MSDDLKTSMHLSASGMRAQSTRLRVISENIANSNSTSEVEGGDPYRRKVITFKNQLDRELDVRKVVVREIIADNSPFVLEYDPSHPGADEQGYVKTPNVNSLLEMVDMREATRTYEANVAAIRTAQNLITQTLDILR